MVSATMQMDGLVTGTGHDDVGDNAYTFPSDPGQAINQKDGIAVNKDNSSKSVMFKELIYSQI